MQMPLWSINSEGLLCACVTRALPAEQKGKCYFSLSVLKGLSAFADKMVLLKPLGPDPGTRVASLILFEMFHRQPLLLCYFYLADIMMLENTVYIVGYLTLTSLRRLNYEEFLAFYFCYDMKALNIHTHKKK